MFEDHTPYRSIEDVEMKLDNLRLMGLNVVKINISNIIPSENTSLVDILNQNPQVTSLGIGVGVPILAIETPSSQTNEKNSKLYNIEQVKTVSMQYVSSDTIEVAMPKNTKDFILNILSVTPKGENVGRFLSRVLAGRCSPAVTLNGVENVETWEGFKIPDKIRTLKIGKRRNIPAPLVAIIREMGFERTSRGDNDVVFSR
jgi:hypothetical protein